MEYTVLGQTGRRVSRLGFGGATAGLKNYIEPFDPDATEDCEGVVEAIRVALAEGINYFDTAAGYGDGASERIFGEGLAEADADEIFLATKVGLWEQRDIRACLEGSLTNLRRDRIDLLQIHGTNYTEEHEEQVLRSGGVLDQLEQLKEEGLIRHVGFTVEAVNPSLYALLRTGRFDTIQMCYNLLFQHPYDPGWKSGCFYEAGERGMGVITMRSATSGMFQRWVQAVNPENTFDYTPALIQYPLSCPFVDVALVGMRDAETVRRNVALVESGEGRVDIEDLFGRYV